MTEQLLDIDTIGRIGLMFLDGDLLADVLVDPYTWDDDDTDYNAENFNALKKVLMKLERMNPTQYITGVLWLWYPQNKRMAVPAVAGRVLPDTGHRIVACTPSMYQALTTGNRTTEEKEGKLHSYFPIKKACGKVVGVLALTYGAEAPLLEWRDCEFRAAEK